MATPKTADSGAPENAPEPAKVSPTHVKPGRVRAVDTVTGNILPYPVPRSWLDGRFPKLKEAPSSKAGK